MLFAQGSWLRSGVRWAWTRRAPGRTVHRKPLRGCGRLHWLRRLFLVVPRRRPGSIATLAQALAGCRKTSRLKVARCRTVSVTGRLRTCLAGGVRMCEMPLLVGHRIYHHCDVTLPPCQAYFSNRWTPPSATPWFLGWCKSADLGRRRRALARRRDLQPGGLRNRPGSGT